MNAPCHCQGPTSSDLVGGYAPLQSRESRIIPILDKRAFNFSNIDTSVSSVKSVSIILCPAICVLEAYRVRLAVRVHTLTITAADQFIRMTAIGIMPSKEDPSQDFLDTNIFLSLDITSTMSAPRLITTTATDPDAYLRITLTGFQGNPAQNLSCELSAALVLRPH